MDNPVGWFEIYVQDMPRAQAFYESLLGTELSPMEMPGIEMRTFPMKTAGTGATGALVKMPGFASGANSVLVYFVCADCALVAGRAAPAGGRVHQAKTSIGEHGNFALVVDTEGNMIGLHSMA